MKIDRFCRLLKMASDKKMSLSAFCTALNMFKILDNKEIN